MAYRGGFHPASSRGRANRGFRRENNSINNQSSTSIDSTRPSKQTTYRIQLKLIDPTKTTSREDVFRITFEKLNVPLIRLTSTQSGFYAVSDDASAVDNLTTKKAELFFKFINLLPIIPPELKAKRSAFIRQLDSHIGSQSTEAILQELESQNKWLKISEVQKIKNYTHIIKITTHSTLMIDRLLDDGLNIFNTRITPAQCEREHYFQLLTCFKCYQYADHPTYQCKSRLTLCSECGSDDHTHKNCTSPTKQCLNCRGTHRTLAASCPIRKARVKELKENTPSDISKPKQISYAGVAQKAARQAVAQATPVPKPEIHLQSGMQTKLVALILEAHIATLSDPRTKFSQTLSESLRLNYGIETIFPDRDSQAIFNLFIGNNTPIQEGNNSSPRSETPTLNPEPHETQHHDSEPSSDSEFCEPEQEEISDSQQPQKSKVRTSSSTPSISHEATPALPLPESPLSTDNSHEAPHHDSELAPDSGLIERDPKHSSNFQKTQTTGRTPQATPKPSSSRNLRSSVPSDFLKLKPVTLFKSDADPSNSKRYLSAKFIVEQIDLVQLGYKMQTEDLSPHRVYQALQREQFDLDLIQIISIPHKDFISKPKLSTKSGNKCKK